jgi:tetratricopeptide (TPR) repeat protein
MIVRTLLLSAIVFCSSIPSARAQSPEPPVPDAGLAAEGIERWDEAVRVYRAALDINPRRANLWIRIADIEARRGDLAAGIDALQHAASASPGSASTYARLSQTYAIAGQPAKALDAIDRAVALEPFAPDYLQSRATLAAWAGDYSRAQYSYRRLMALQPDNIDLALSYGQVSAWNGDTDEAVSGYERYLAARPDASDVWIELAKVESWRGNFAAAAQTLDAYRARFGESPAYSNALAAVMTGGGRPAKAKQLLTPLLERSPNDYGLNLARAIALAMQQRTREAFKSRETARQVAPGGRETTDGERVLRTLLSSTADAQFSFSTDSDSLDIQRVAPRATIALPIGTRLTAGYENTRLDLGRVNGLQQVDGSLSAQYKQTTAGAAHTFGRLTVNGQLGYAVAERNDLTTYALGFEVRPADSLRVAMQRAFGFYVVSPRTVGSGLTQTGERLQINWTPTLRYEIAVDASYQELSDGNRRWEIALAPRRTMVRTARLNLDLGLSAYRLGTAQDLANGYYDPSLYEQYAVTAYPYFKLAENVGIAVSAALGTQREGTSRPFRFGGSVSGEATFGIYEPWVLKVGGSATLNRRLDSGAYRGLGAHAVLVRRF